jgi:hypothetical protein
MSETALQNALARRAALLQELEKLDSFIELYHELSRGSDMDKSSEPAPSGMTLGPSLITSGRVFVAGHTRVRPRSLAPMVREILLEQGRPMTRTQITEALRAKNITMPSPDEARYLGTILWRFRDEFINIEGEGYWPRDIPCQAVEYVPTEIEEAFNSTPAEGGSPH